jgi:polyhydroxyalkanoate synthesis repressor PhaR
MKNVQRFAQAPRGLYHSQRVCANLQVRAVYAILKNRRVLFMTAETPIPAEQPSPTIIKKYANRRLYNTATSAYITLERLADMVKQNIDFVVQDAKTSEDITRSVLTQIIFEQEGKSGQSLLPISFLRQLIGFYGDNLQTLLSRYLEVTMGNFTQQQDQLRQYMEPFFPFGNTFQEASKTNAQFLEKTMRIFTPFGQFPLVHPSRSEDVAAAEPPVNVQERLALLEKEIKALRAEKK